MRTRSLLVALLAIVVVSSAACGDDDSGGGSGDLDAVEVVLGSDGEPPTFEFDPPFAVTETVKRVLEAGDGDAAADGSAVIFHFVFVNGRDGSEVSTSYGLEPATVTVDEALLPGVRIALTGAQAGERSLVAIAPGDAFAGQGDDEETGVREDDTLLLYLEVHDVRTPLARAEGTPVEPVEGLPTVELDEVGAPRIAVPEGDPPSELVAQVLIQGEGPEVEAGQQITVHYTGVLWDTAQQFDSSWDRGTPATFAIGVDAVIDGWDEGLVGQAIGSQVLLVVPPEQAYGDTGQGPIPPGATLVFVVDILDAH